MVNSLVQAQTLCLLSGARRWVLIVVVMVVVGEVMV
jgi:hypothetical protein